MAERSWLELSDDDEKVDSEEARKIIEARLKKRKEEAERMSAPPTTAAGRGPLQRSVTVNNPGYLPGVDSRNRGRAGGGGRASHHRRGGFVSCYGLLDSPSSGTSTTTSFTPNSTHSGATGSSSSQHLTSLNIQPINLVRPSVPSYTVDGDDVIFSETYDIWFTDPSVISTRGTSKDMYEHACCYVGSFHKISEFYAFHNAIDWDNIPDGSVVAYCKKDIKPQWEAPMNAHGGRFMFKHFPRRCTERVFTKIALGFLSGLLTDWHHYNLVSLHIRSSARGSDIQLWRRIANATGVTATVVLNDIKALIFEDADGSETFGNGTINWMPNSGSVQRNDHRINHFKQKHSGSGLMSTQSLDSGIRLMEEDVTDLWASSASSRGGLSEEMRRAMVAAADAELSNVTPTGLGLRSDDCISNFHPSSSTTKRNKLNSIANVLSENSTGSTTDSPTSSSQPTARYSKEFVKAAPTLRRTQQHVCAPTPTAKVTRKFCFTQVAELLPSSTDASQSCSEAGTESDSSKKPISKMTLTQNRPYPAYDAPISMQAWHRGKALKEHAAK